MEGLKKFTMKSFIEAMIEDVNAMDREEAETLLQGVKILKDIVDRYMQGRCGSTKRSQDLNEYMYIITETLKAKYGI